MSAVLVFEMRIVSKWPDIDDKCGLDFDNLK